VTGEGYSYKKLRAFRKELVKDIFSVRASRHCTNCGASEGKSVPDQAAIRLPSFAHEALTSSS